MKFRTLLDKASKAQDPKEEYALLAALKKKIELHMEDLRPGVEFSGNKEVIGKIGQYVKTKNPASWRYSPAVTKAEQSLKAMQQQEQVSGQAEKKEGDDNFRFEVNPALLQ